MREIPPPQAAFLALDDEHCLTREHEEVLLVVLPVVHRHRLAGAQNAEVDPDLRESRLTLERANRRAPFGVKPGRVARVEHEPALATRYKTVLGRLKARLGDHPREDSRRGPSPAEVVV